MEEVFHSGEREIQNITGEWPIADRNSAMIADTIVKGAIHFLEKQPMVVVSSKNNKDEIWISLVIGSSGLISVPDQNNIFIDTNKITSNPDDIFFENIKTNHEIGSCFIELGTRRRFRINGSCTMDGSKIHIQIKEAYPNCPKYIQRRQPSLPEYYVKTIPKTEEGIELTPETKQWITNADTFFVGSSGTNGRLDASHRGGFPHFVEVLTDGTLKIPDYSGNSLFNTLGNFAQNPNAGLLFINFEKGETLQLTGKAKLLFDQQTEDDLNRTTGTGRYWLFNTSRWIHTIGHHHVEWEFLDYSPYNP